MSGARSRHSRAQAVPRTRVQPRGSGGVQPSEAQANALLLSAAPELLAALEKLLDWAEDWGVMEPEAQHLRISDWEGVSGRAEAAIKKARGE